MSIKLALALSWLSGADPSQLPRGREHEANICSAWDTAAAEKVWTAIREEQRSHEAAAEAHAVALVGPWDRLTTLATGDERHQTLCDLEYARLEANAAERRVLALAATFDEGGVEIREIRACDGGPRQ